MNYAGAKAVFAAIAAAMAIGNELDRKRAFGEIPQYRPRGKGRGTPSKKFGNPGGKYTPHQGSKECARRVRQMKRDALMNPFALRKAA